MSGRDEDALPPSGLAEDLIPLLRKRLGKSEAPAGSALMRFADEIEHRSAAAEPDRSPRLRQVVTFAAGDVDYGVPIESVHEILRVSPLTRVPQAPAHIRGVMNVRGRLLAVADFGRCVGAEEVTIDKRSRIVVVELEGRRIGLLVEQASYVLSLADTSIQPPPPDALASAEFITGVAASGKRLVLLLDLQRLLNQNG